jgi:Tol biopolymer transport system component
MTSANFGAAPAKVSPPVAPARDPQPAARRSLAWLWILPVVASPFVAALLWLDSPLSPPQVSGITQITHDNLGKTNVFSDGSHLYIGERSGGHQLISQVAVSGSDFSTLQTPFASVSVQAISPDHSAILATAAAADAEDALWSIPRPGGAPRRLANLSGRNATWAPDGQHILFVKESSLYLANADGSQTYELTSVSGTLFYPRFSPDGKRIRFSINDAGQSSSSIWEIKSDGTGLHALFPGWHSPAAECCGTWTADGRYYIFQVAQTRPANATNLWALAEPVGRWERKSSDKPVQLSYGPTSFANPTPDPSGEKIWALGVHAAGELVKYDAKSKQVVPLVAGISGTDLDFSRDGQWVAYVAIPEGTLWRSRLDGTERLRLTAPSQQVALPRWSPDGKRIAYMSLRSGEPWKILLVSSTGGASQELLPESRDQVDVNWSPDGKQIVFGNVWQAKSPAINILDLNSHQLSTIPGSTGLFSPRWSPDGRYIAALSTDFKTLMLYDFHTRKWAQWLTEAAGAVSYPAWSADSTYLYFEDLVTGEDSFRRVKVGRNQAESVFALEGLERYPGPFGLWSGRAPDGSEVFVRDHSTQEVYGLDIKLP